MASVGEQRRRSGDSQAGRNPQKGNKPDTSIGSLRGKMPPGKTWLWFLGILLANYLLARFFFPGPEAPLTIPYTLFKEQAGKGNVESIYSRGESITGSPSLERISESTNRGMVAPVTIGMKPRSLPSARSAGPKPQSPGLRRPQL